MDGTWTFTAEESATTSVYFVAEGTLRGLMHLLEPIAGRMMRRQFADYHTRLRRNVEALEPGRP